ncbi:MAG: ATP synthase F1 subunit delta [Bacteroidota bacterium]
MNEGQISVRYAKALFQSASEKQLLDRVYRDMEVLADTCKLEDFQYMLALPSLQSTQKCAIVEAVLKDQISDLSNALINLVIKNKREEYLPGIARYFRDLFRKTMGIRSASLVTAQPVDDDAMKNIKALISKAYDSDVELSSSVSEDVIGGFVLTIEDMRYDASVAASLRKIKKQLVQTSLENK